MATKVKIIRNKDGYIKKIICPVCGSSKVTSSDFRMTDHTERGLLTKEIQCSGCRVRTKVEFYLNDH